MTKSIRFYFCSFGTCSTHTHQHAQLKEGCAVQNSRKTELISDSFLLPRRPKEDFLTIAFLKEGTFICKCLVGSSDTKCSINHKVIVWHRSSNSDLCGSLVCLWRGECQTAEREEETQHHFHQRLPAPLCRSWRAEHSSSSSLLTTFKAH